MHSESLWMAVSESGWRQPQPTQPGAFVGTESWRQATTPVLAQEQFDQDILGDLGNAIGYFIESGQVWALLVGFILGYLLRSVTTFR